MKRHVLWFAIVFGLVGVSLAMRLSSTNRLRTNATTVAALDDAEEANSEEGVDSEKALSPAASRHPSVIEGVQPYALDQPRVPALLQPSASSPPLSVYAEEAGQNVFAFDAFLDTGSSRLALSYADTSALKVQHTAQTVEDIGIGGKETFDVSIPYRMRVGDSHTDTQDEKQFRNALDCVLELRRSDQNVLNALPPSLNQMLSGELKELDMKPEDMGEAFVSAVSIVGTPFIQRHIVLLDPRPVMDALGNVVESMGSEDKGGKGGDGLDKLLEDAEKAGGGINNFGRIGVRVLPEGAVSPASRVVVPLTMKDAEEGRPPVTHATVPFIANVALQHRGRTARADLLLDTGGGVSLLSPKLARELGLNLEHPQIVTKVQGVGQGSGDLKGFWIDRLTLPSSQGERISYLRAPLFVADIAGIDGSLGMNFLGPSVYLNLGNFDISHPMDLLNSMRPGPLPFQRIIIDIPHRRLGLDPA